MTVQAFDRRDDVPRKHAIEAAGCDHALRVLEVRVVQVDTDGARLVRGRGRRAGAGVRQVRFIDGERRDAGAGARETHQAQASVLERVRDENERRRSREDTDVAAQLIRLIPRDVPVESNTRRPVGALLRIPRCVNFLPRGSEELRDDVILARVPLNLRDVHADARGHRQRSTRPLVLHVQARHGRVERAGMSSLLPLFA